MPPKWNKSLRIHIGSYLLRNTDKLIDRK